MFKKFAKNDEGVSAVIGVILMVAITVILAAVIAAFVFGMVGGVQKKVTPAFTVNRLSPDDLQITLADSGGATSINNLILTTTPASGAITYKIMRNSAVLATYHSGDATPDANALQVGDIIDITGAAGATPFNSPVSLSCTAVVNGGITNVLTTNL